MELLLHILRNVPIEKFCNLLTLYVHREIDRIKSLFELVIKVINQYIQCTLNYLKLHNSAKLVTYKIKVIYQCVVLFSVQFVIC